MKKPAKYDHAKIEAKWQKKWARSKLYKTKEDPAKGKFYVLDMFPYPSGEGLHVGHPKGYIATDVISRMKRMQGMNVLHPMGFDAFGLPAENYALKTKTNPEIAVRKNVARYKKQLELLGFDYDWSREVNTTDPAYYRWTQWIFLQLFKKGLAYESYEPVNWCPTDKTVLANEDVENGRCERCGTPVEKKPLRQWVLKITDYADRLLHDLDARADIPLFKKRDGDDAVKEGVPFAERNAAVCVVKHWSEDKYLCLDWKQVSWKGFVVGGIEHGEKVEETAVREVAEETGYQSAKFIRHICQVDSQFFQPVKKVNRFAHFSAVYLELADGTRKDVDEKERALHEAVWVSRDRVHEYIDRDDMRHIWDVFIGKKKIEKGPLLDWPESIKEAQRNWIGRSEGAEIDFRLTIPKNKPRFVILHGYKGSAKTNFIPWLKKELEKRGHEVEAPELPHSNDPKEAEQVEYALKHCRFDEHTVVVGHSLGAIVALKALMKLDKPISGLLLVAAAMDPAHGKKHREYWEHFNWDIDYVRIQKLASGRIAVLSDLQETARAPYLKQLAHKLDAKLVETAAKEEHFCAREEPAVLECVTPSVKVFTTRPDTIFGVTYVVLAPEHPWVGPFLEFLENRAEVEAYIAKAQQETEIQRSDVSKEKTGVELKGIKAVNPANGEEVPVWIADYVLADYGTGAVMAVPAHDERDADFAKKYGLPIREIKLEDKEEIIKKFGKKVVKYKLHDWVFSRQRYWGEPIPLIRCESCGVVPVPEKDLPVKLPKVKSYEPTGTGESPLAAISKWVNVKCPQCKGPAKRETNTMPQWAGSCWYYLRYEDPLNKTKLVDPKKEKYWSPVDLYVGGAEHATRHLIYARFWHKFLNDIGVVSTIEPFKKLQSVGLIIGEDGRKMSKRFGNVVNPDTIVQIYGTDTLRLYEMFMGPFDQSIAWSMINIVGSRRFIERLWNLRHLVGGHGDHAAADRTVNKAVKKVTEDIQAMKYNTAVSTLMITLHGIEKQNAVSREQYETILKLVAPFAPHVAEELWASLGNKKSIHVSEWPSYDAALAADEEMTIAVQVNGKVRGSFASSPGASEEELKSKALGMPEVAKWLEGKEVKKVIVIKDRIVSIVAG